MENAKRKRVLIIEDEKSYAMVEAMLIEEIGFVPIFPAEVSSQGQALEWIRKFCPDIILLDMNFSSWPRLDKTADGFRVIESLTEDERKKVVCVSGSIAAYIELLQSLRIRHFSDKTEFINCLEGKCECGAQ